MNKLANKQQIKNKCKNSVSYVKFFVLRFRTPFRMHFIYTMHASA